MSESEALSSKKRFIKGADAWIKSEWSVFGKYWLDAPCCLLAYAREVGCRFDDEAREKLKQLEQTDHEEKAAQLYPQFFGQNPPAPEEADAIFRQAAQLMRGLIHGVRAAMALVETNWRHGTSPLPDQFIEHAQACCEAYQAAWPIGQQDPQAAVTPGSIWGPADLAPNENPAANALQAVVNGGQLPDLRVSTWLAVRHLIDHLLPGNDSPTGEPVEATVLFCLGHVRSPEEQEGEGTVRPLEVFKQVEGHFGFYVDPVAMGPTLMDPSMIQSLDWAWRACRPQIEKAMADRGQNVLPAIRLAPRLSAQHGQVHGVWRLSGGSAGGLVASAMYAAAMDTRLNTDASASVALKLREGQDPAGDLDVSNILVAPVSDDSIGPKLRAAKAAGQRRVVLEKGQAEWANDQGKVPDGLDVPGVTTLAEVYDLLTGEARIERVIEAYCRRVGAEWQRALADPKDMKHYVEPHYSLLAEGEEGGPHDSSQVRRGPGDEEPHGPKYDPVGAEGDSAEEELVKLIQVSRRLCISEDAGAGKTIFTRRLQAFLSGEEGQRRVLEGKPCLVVRFERRSVRWPSDFRNGLVQRLAEQILDDCPGSTRERKQLAADVAEWALEHHRVVLILDALDQVGDDASIESLHEFLTPEPEKTPRVVLTCRSFAVTKRSELFTDKPGWRHGRIEGFNARQQYLCLWDILKQEGQTKPATEGECPSERECKRALGQLVANYEEVKELLRVPQVLDHILQLHAGGRLRPFRSRGDLYQQVEQAVLDAAALRILGRRPQRGRILQWRRLMAAAAFEMMTRKTHYDYAVEGAEAVKVQEAASKRCESPYDPDQWEQIEEVSECTNRQLVEGSTREFFGFKHRGAMEYYCALHLVDNRQSDWVRRATEEQIAAGQPPVRCGDPKLAEMAGDEDWTWAFRFAIELATHVPPPGDERQRLPASVTPDRERTAASLAELFLPRGEGRGRRPTELIYRAWHLFERDPLVLREQGLTAEQAGELSLPWAEQIVAYYRHREGETAEIIEELKEHGFVPCPPDGSPAEFLMGSPEGVGYDSEHPQIQVVLKPFHMQATTVTQAQYRLFDPEHERVEADDFERYSSEDDCPVIDVSWYDAFAFAKWLGAEYRLPTEIEWEFACRASRSMDPEESTRWCFGNNEAELDDYAWYSANSEHTTHAVGQLKSNDWDLFDMHGNVWEWCHDWYGSGWYATQHSKYGSQPAPDEGGATAGSSRCLRGGAFDDFADPCRSADRDAYVPAYRYHYSGFRLVCGWFLESVPGRPQ